MGSSNDESEPGNEGLLGDDSIVEFEKITVKFQISDSQIVAQVYPNCMTIFEVKKDLGRKFEVFPSDLIIFDKCFEVANDDCTLRKFERNDFGILEFILDYKPKEDAEGKEAKKTLDLDVYYNKYRLPDFITVHFPAEENNGISKNVVVEIQNQAIVKPFTGGYKNPKTGIEYHDAFSQTGPVLEKFKYKGILTRQTQTKHYKTNSTDTTYDQGTQSFGDATNFIFVAAATDVVIIPKKYKSYAQIQRQENRLGKIIMIQRNFRAYLMRQFIKRAAAEYRRLVEDRERKLRQVEENQKRKFRRECVVKTFPRTKEDFDLLYSQVQKWKEAEIKRICELYSEGPRIVEFNILLDKEIELLNGIERQKMLVFKALEDYREEQLLKRMGEPVKWIGYKDQVVEMDLIRTQRVRFLSQVLKDLKQELSRKDRMELIKKVLIVLENEEPIPAVTEIQDLFEREMNLLVHTKYCDVSILRKRQNVLFLEIIKHRKDKVDSLVKEPETRMCDTCKEVKTLKNFALKTRQNVVEICKRCFYLTGKSPDISIFRSILRSIQREERNKGTLTSYAFVLQEDDIKDIIIKIFHGHSLLSKNTDLPNLRLPRWIKSEEWSPWNCICLTEAESRDHNNIIDINDFYDASFHQQVKNKHLLAMTVFRKLNAVDYEFVESGDWWEVGVKQKIV